MDVTALVAAGVGAVVGLLGWKESRASNHRANFTAITGELRTDLTEERTQRRLLAWYVVDLWRWGQRVGPDTPAGPPPDPPAELDLSPWQR
ncbi:hypothetical protein ACFQ7W_00865 [Streptomyces niveus]|uniref:hypothetical protein n=1 Tax=Streptomyces niveus TaxID=193462 RepID=UPI0036AE7CAC